MLKNFVMSTNLGQSLGSVRASLICVAILQCVASVGVVNSHANTLKERTIQVPEGDLFSLQASTNEFGYRTGQEVSITGSFSTDTSVLETGGMMHFGVPSVTETTVKDKRLYRRTFSFINKNAPSHPDGTLLQITGVIKRGGGFHYPIAELYEVTLTAHKAVDFVKEISEGKVVIERLIKESDDFMAGVSSLDLSKKSLLSVTKSLPLSKAIFLSEAPRFYSADMSNSRFIYTVRGPNVGDNAHQRHLYLYVVYNFVRREVERAFLTIVMDYIWLE
jgi:hypothetical protein